MDGSEEGPLDIVGWAEPLLGPELGKELGLLLGTELSDGKALVTEGAELGVTDGSDDGTLDTVGSAEPKLGPELGKELGSLLGIELSDGKALVTEGAELGVTDGSGDVFDNTRSYKNMQDGVFFHQTKDLMVSRSYVVRNWKTS